LSIALSAIALSSDFTAASARQDEWQVLPVV